MKVRSLVLAGGGTGGHLFPALAIAHYFSKQQPQCKIRFVGSKQGIESKIIPQTPYSLHYLPIAGLYRVGFFKKILSLALLPFAILRSIYFLLVWRPEVVIGVGGYSSGPFLLACILLRKKFFLQEQNAYPGITNRFLGKYAALSFLVYPDQYHFFQNFVVTGNPIRNEIHQLWKNNPRPKSKKFYLSILGGSQGSSFINQLVMETLPKLKPILAQISVSHQSGILDYEKLQVFYKKNSVEHRLEPFFQQMTELYQQTHLFICRSGAGVFEMMAAGRIGILIPIANSSGDHQKKNALQLEKNGGCFLLEEKNATSEKLAQLIKKIYYDRKELQRREKLASASYYGDASEKIYNAIFQFYQN